PLFPYTTLFRSRTHRGRRGREVPRHEPCACRRRKAAAGPQYVLRRGPVCLRPDKRRGGSRCQPFGEAPRAANSRRSDVSHRRELGSLRFTRQVDGRHGVSLVASRIRVSTAIQLVSQVFPPSSENACSNRSVSGETCVMTKRARIVRPSTVSTPKNSPIPSVSCPTSGGKRVPVLLLERCRRHWGDCGL